MANFVDLLPFPDKHMAIVHFTKGSNPHFITEKEASPRNGINYLNLSVLNTILTGEQ